MTRMLDVGPVRAFAAAAGVVALVAVAGCGGSDETTAKQDAPAAKKAPAAVVADELVGTWTRTVRLDRSTYVPPGKHTLKVRPDGGVDLYGPRADSAGDCLTQANCEQIEVSGSNGKLTIGRTMACLGASEYSYKVTGNKLRTERVKDECAQDRPQFFAGATWSRDS